MGWLDSLAQEALEALVAARSAWPQAQQVDQTLSRLGVQTTRAGDVRAGAGDGDGTGLGLVVESTATFRSRRQSPSLFSPGPEEEDEDEDEWVYDESQGSAANTPPSNPPRSQYAAFAPSFPHSPSPAQARAAQRLLSRLGVSSAEQWRQADAEQMRNLIVALAEQVASPPHQQQQGQAAEGQAETILTALLQLGARWDSLPTRPRNKLALALARSLSSESDSARRRAAALSVGVGMRREVVPKQLRPLCLLGEGLLGSVE